QSDNLDKLNAKLKEAQTNYDLLSGAITKNVTTIAKNVLPLPAAKPGPITLPQTVTELTAKQIENAQKALDVETKQNAALQAQLTGQDDLVRSLDVEAQIRDKISNELRSQQPAIANGLEEQIRLHQKLELEIKQEQELSKKFGELWDSVTSSMQ